MLYCGVYSFYCLDIFAFLSVLLHPSFHLKLVSYHNSGGPPGTQSTHANIIHKVHFAVHSNDKYSRKHNHTLSRLTVLGAGEAGGHKPQHFFLPCHILAFLSSGSHKPQPFRLPCHNIRVFRQLLRFLMVNLVH